MKQSTTIEKALAFLDNVKSTLEVKNQLYGDAAANPMRIFSKSPPDEQLLVRIDDKLSRIARGTGVENEDVLLDLCGYIAILHAVRRDQ